MSAACGRPDALGVDPEFAKVLHPVTVALLATSGTACQLLLKESLPGAPLTHPQPEDTSIAAWILDAHVVVFDTVAYLDCSSLVQDVLAGFGGRLFLRCAPQEVIEGEMRPRMIVVRFPDLATAKTCYALSEDQTILPLRTR